MPVQIIGLIVGTLNDTVGETVRRSIPRIVGPHFGTILRHAQAAITLASIFQTECALFRAKFSLGCQIVPIQICRQILHPTTDSTMAGMRDKSPCSFRLLERGIRHQSIGSSFS